MPPSLVEVDFPPNDSASAADQISRCVIDVKAWLASRYLLLNEAKTQTILFTTPNQRTPQPRPLVIDICGRNVTTSASIRDLGVHLDSTLSMTAHVSRTCTTNYNTPPEIANGRLNPTHNNSGEAIATRQTIVKCCVIYCIKRNASL